MRKGLTVCVALILAGGLASCDAADPTAPDASALSTVAARLAPAPNATLVPIHGIATLAVDLTGGFLPCVLEGTDLVVAQFPGRFRSEGAFSHLGRTTSLIELLACTASLDGSISGPGQAVHTAANGDELWADWSGTFQADGSSELWVTWTGGTGRFANATGGAHGGGSSDPVTFAGTWWFEGTVSRVGTK